MADVSERTGSVSQSLGSPDASAALVSSGAVVLRGVV
jgi:hypothetical protein